MYPINLTEVIAEFKRRELNGLPQKEKRRNKEGLDAFCEYIDYNPHFTEQDVVGWLKYNKKTHRDDSKVKDLIIQFSTWLTMWERLETFRKK